MSRLRILFLAFVASPIFAGKVVAAAPPDASAKQRAVAYQQATRAVLTREHWRITVDQPGKLVGQHLIILPYPPGEVGGYSQVMIAFRPKSTTDTECSINLAHSLYGRSSSGDIQKSFTKPIHVTTPEATEEITRMLGQARKHLAAEHPEYFTAAAR